MTEKSDEAEGDTRVQWRQLLISMRVCGHESLEKRKNDVQSSLEIEEKDIYIT